MNGLEVGMMKFGIVGAGAMGCLLGSFLGKVKEDVWLVDIWEDHVARIKKNGLMVMKEGRSEIVRIPAATHPEEVGICDVVIISTKFHHTRTAVQSASCMIGDETVVMTIQNGIGNVEIISEFVNSRQIIFGLTTLGSVIKGPGMIEVTFSQSADTFVWPLVGEPWDKVQKAISAFNRAGLNFHLSPDVRERIWKKLCLNASLSVVLAIPRLKCGDFINQPSSFELIKGLVDEIVAVANNEGVILNPEEAYEYVLTLGKQAPDHLPSPLMDVLNRRKTEIDCLNGAIVEKAKQWGIEVPYNTVIYHLVKIIESTYNEFIQHQ
jgi:2-dehydropantoate 2-reductase